MAISYLLGSFPLDRVLDIEVKYDWMVSGRPQEVLWCVTPKMVMGEKRERKERHQQFPNYNTA
jgi:hypothetical protein